MCCFKEDQIPDTEGPIADSLGFEVSDVKATSYTQFTSYVEAAKTGDRRRFLALTDEAWTIEYLVAVRGIHDTLNTIGKLKNVTFVNEIGESISKSMNVNITLITTKHIDISTTVLSSPTSAPMENSQNPTLKPTPSTILDQKQTSAETTLPIIFVVVIGIGFVIISICAIKFDYKAIKRVHAKPINDNVVPPTSTNI